MTNDTNFDPKILVLTAPLGTGKSTVAEILAQDPRFVLNMSATTRPKRQSETDGVDYRFVSEDEFRRLIGEKKLVEYTEFNGNFYGTLREDVDRLIIPGKVLVCAIDWYGLRAMRADYPKQTVGVFMRPPSKYEVLVRLQKRGSSEEETVKRMETYDEYMMHMKEYDHVVVNNDLERTAQAIKDIVFDGGRGY